MIELDAGNLSVCIRTSKGFFFINFIHIERPPKKIKKIQKPLNDGWFNPFLNMVNMLSPLVDVGLVNSQRTATEIGPGEVASTASATPAGSPPGRAPCASSSCARRDPRDEGPFKQGEAVGEFPIFLEERMVELWGMVAKSCS